MKDIIVQLKQILIFLSLLLSAFIANADSINSVNQNLGALVQQINKVNQDLTHKQKQKNDLNKTISDSDNALISGNKLLKQLQTTRDMNLQQLQNISESIPQLTDLTNQSKQQVQLAINKIYQQLRVVQSESSSIFNGNSNVDTQRKKVYLTQLLKFEQQKYQSLKVKLDSLNELNAKLQSEVDRLNKQLAATSKKQELLRQNKQSKIDMQANLDKQIANSKNKLSDLKQKQAKLNDLVLQLRKAQAKLEADAKLAKASPNKATTKNKIPAKNSVGEGLIDDNSPLLSRKLTKPMDASVAIGFGELRDGVPNSGVVFDTQNNAHVYAISNGKVLYSGTLPGFGQLVVVDNGNDYNSIYSGVISLVKKGDTVSGGQVIASSGAPSNQPMGGVYFELRHLGRPINPSSVFN